MIGKGTDERNRTGKRYEVRKVGNVRVDVSGMFIIMCLLQREAEIEKKGQYNQPYGNTISQQWLRTLMHPA